MVERLVLLASCLALWTAPVPAGAGGVCVEDYTEGVDYFPASNRTSVSHAMLFELKYGKSFKVVTAKLAREQYVLEQCGTPHVEDSVVDATAPLPPGHRRKRFTIPLCQTGTDSSVLSFFEQLGLADRLRFTTEFAVGACWQKAHGCNSAYDADNYTRRREQDATLDAAFVDSLLDRSGNAAKPYVAFSASYEASPLGSAEHVKFLGAFFNKEKEAEKIFDSVVGAYRSQQVAPGSNAQTVAWIERSSWPVESFKVSLASYKQTYVIDAGALSVDGRVVQNQQPKFAFAPILPKNPESGHTLLLPLDGFGSKANASAAFFGALASVDVVIDETYSPQPWNYDFDAFLRTFDLDRSSQLKFVANKKVFRVDGTLSAAGHLDWFESRFAHPQWVLDDLARAVRGRGSSARFLRNIAQSEVPKIVTQDACSERVPSCDNVAAKGLLLLPDAVDGSVRVVAGLWLTLALAAW